MWSCFGKKNSCKHVRFRDAWFIYTSLKTAVMVIYPRLPVLAPEVRCFFLYVFGVQSYLLTFGVWKPRDSCKMLKQKPIGSIFLHKELHNKSSKYSPITKMTHSKLPNYLFAWMFFGTSSQLVVNLNLAFFIKQFTGQQLGQ